MKQKYELGEPAPTGTPPFTANDDGTRYNANTLHETATGRSVAQFWGLPQNRTLDEMEAMAHSGVQERLKEAKAIASAANNMPAMREALEACLAYIVRKNVHTGCMSLDEIKAAEARYLETTSETKIAHSITEDGPRVNLAGIRALLEATKG